MVKAIDSMCDTFNKGVNNLSNGYVQLVSSKKAILKAAFGPVVKPVIATDPKRLSHNIKVVAHNAVTVLAIASVAGIIFGGPLGLLSLGASIGARMFINHAMEREAQQRGQTPHQATDKSIYSFLFKPLA